MTPVESRRALARRDLRDLRARSRRAGRARGGARRERARPDRPRAPASPLAPEDLATGLRASLADAAGGRAADVARQPGPAAPNRLPGAPEGGARLRLHAPRPLGGDRVSRTPRRARGCSGAAAAAARGGRRARARLRCLCRRLGRGRWRRSRRACPRRARRRRPGGGRLLVRARLRRSRACRPTSALPRRRGGRDRRPGRRAGRGRVCRRRHRRQLHDVVPDARRRARGVGGTRLPVRRARAEPRRRLRAPSRQHRPQPAFPPGRADGARARVARLARGADAARRRRLRAGRRLRLVRLRLSARREAVDDADVARGRSRPGSAARGRGEGATCPRRERESGGRRRGPGAGAVPRSRRGGGCDRDPCAPAALGPPQPEHRPLAPAPPCDGGLRRLRRGDPPLGRDAAGSLLGSVPLPRRRLRRQARDGAAASRAADGGAAVGER